MSFPNWALAYETILFLITAAFSYVFSRVYMRMFSKNKTRFYLAETITTFGLWTTMLTLFLLPYDVFVVSFLKNDNGTFKDWVTPSAKNIGYRFLNAYLVTYALILFYLFFCLPFLYFAYEKTEAQTSSPICFSLLYAVFFGLSVGVLITIGAFIPYQRVPDIKNATYVHDKTWADLKSEIARDRHYSFGDGFAFIISIIIMFGSTACAIYTALGLSSFPIENFRGWRTLPTGVEMISERQDTVRQTITDLRIKMDNNEISSKELRRLSEYENEEAILTTLFEDMAANYNPWKKMKPIVKVCNILLGIICMMGSIIIWVSLLIANLERGIYSDGYMQAYLLPIFKYFYPLDYILVACQNGIAFDHFVYFFLVIYLITCTFSGIQYLGICVWRSYTIAPHLTDAQGMIVLSATVICTVVSLNILIFELAPQYSTFGSQQYYRFNTTHNTAKTLPCNHIIAAGACKMTRFSWAVLGYSYRTPFFVSLYYYLSWIFLFVGVLGFFLVIFKQGPLIGNVYVEDETDSNNENCRNEQRDVVNMTAITRT